MDQASKGIKTRERILSTTMKVIHENGYNNTSINDIIDATGVKKGNLYFHFSSKEKLTLGLIQKAREDYLKYLKDSTIGESPFDRIESMLMSIYNYHRKLKFKGGCLFGNMALEMGGINEEFSKLIKDIFNEWIQYLTEMIQSAKKIGELPEIIDEKQLARHIIAAMEGGVMMAKVNRDGEYLLNSIKSIMQLMGKK